MDRPEYPYRECKNCDGVICCRNLVIEELTGIPKPPDDCIKKTEIEKELENYYNDIRESHKGQ
jgi:hypothetical protein